jgi:hypothetical protein
MKRSTMLSAAVAAAVFSLSVSMASAASLTLFVFDPDDLGGTSATRTDNQGCDRNTNGSFDKGIVLFKLGATSENKAAGATINSIAGKNLCGVNASVSWEQRPQGSCGAGSPRYNIITKDTQLHFTSCSAMTKSAPDPDSGCVTATANVHNGSQVFPPLPTSGNGCIVQSMEIVMDEGTDAGPGFAILDNFDIFGTKIDPQ